MKSYRAVEMKSVILVYGVLVAVSALADVSIYKSPIGSWSQSKPPSWLMILAGLVFVAAYFSISAFIFHFVKVGTELEKVFRQILTPLSYVHIVIFALLSGFIEEWFFRGILLQHFGIVLSSLFFALGHFLPVPRLWIWSLWCFGMGVILALFYKASGSLVLVGGIHALINAVILLRLNRDAHETPALPSGF